MTIVVNENLDKLLFNLARNNIDAIIQYDGRGDIRKNEFFFHTFDIRYLKDLGYLKFKYTVRDVDTGRLSRHYRGGNNRFHNYYTVTEAGKDYLRRKGYTI